MNKKNLPKAIRPEAAQEAAQEASQAAAAAATMEPAPAAAASPASGPAPRKPAAGTKKQAVAADAPEVQERRARAMAVVKRLSLWSGAAGLIPVPYVDLAAVGGVQVEMLRRISKIYAVPFSKNSGKAVIAGVAGSMIPASSGIGAASLIKGVPGVGTAVSALTMPVLSVGATYAIGMAFIQHFASGGTLLDFDPPDYKEFLKTDKPSPGAKASAAQTA